jgi:hypothetical protein
VIEFFDSRLRAFSFWLFYTAFSSEKLKIELKTNISKLDNSRELQGYNKISQNNKQLKIYFFSLSIVLSARVDGRNYTVLLVFQIGMFDSKITLVTI